MLSLNINIVITECYFHGTIERQYEKGQQRSQIQSCTLKSFEASTSLVYLLPYKLLLAIHCPLLMSPI